MLFKKTWVWRENCCNFKSWLSSTAVEIERIPLTLSYHPSLSAIDLSIRTELMKANPCKFMDTGVSIFSSPLENVADEFFLTSLVGICKVGGRTVVFS